ncbi:putative FCP1 domain, HAD-like domain-containing protein [Rosa chinensis]|uniref:Mitochondrial import inner membrane translocase subunit TIM50 n=1 Tax=Rosa chinensis TaxID=74649 RepID=A0A2P6S3T9_ROSCH|nr:uncharacterized protein LOC112189359 [Rosa chinensis]PRQ53353.1 putative FCP1 domain, HAD-like domain-containing protein [Rosa chinensis]
MIRHTSSFSMTKGEVQVNLLANSAPRPSFVKIPETGMDTAKNISESSQVLKKRTRRRHRRKPNLMQNTGVVHNLPQEHGQVDTKYIKRLSTLSLSDERGSDVLVISSGAVKTNCEEDIRSGISHGSIVRKPFRYTGKKLLILDINGLIADIVSPPPKGFASDIRIAGRAIFKRPYYLDFLKFCFERFEVGVWSSRSKKIVERVVDYLMGDLKHKLLFCWDLSHCTTTGFRTLENKHKTLVFKDLRRIWEEDDSGLPWEKGVYDESNTLLLDDSPYKALLNPAHTGVFPYPYTFHGGCDNALGPGGRLRTYLEKLAAAENLQEFVDQHPFGQRPITERSASWDFYLRVLDTVYSVKTNQITWNSTCKH